MLTLQSAKHKRRNDNGGTNAASQQITTRHYADAYSASQKQTICLALVFDKNNRGLIDWTEVEGQEDRNL